MKRYLPVLLLVSSVCWSSCEKEIKFTGEITDPVLVMNGFLTPDSVVSVQLSQSRFIFGETLDEAPPVVENASVSLKVNGEFKENLQYMAEGIYRGAYFPKSGDLIRVEAKAEGFNDIWGETLIPRKPQIEITDSLSTVEITGKYPVNESKVEEIRFVNWSAYLQLKMIEHADEENFYFVKGQKYFHLEDGRTLPMYVNLHIKDLLETIDPDHANFLEEELFGGYSHMVENLFSDRFVNGKDISFNFSFSDQVDTKMYVNGVETEEPKQEAEIEISVEISGMSNGMYHYIVSASKSNATDGNFLVEPVQIYSNIENGAGILASYVPYAVIFRYKKRYDADVEDPRYPW